MFKRTVTQLACPNRQHRKSDVDAFGTCLIRGTRYQRYRCRPRSGPSHTFSVRLTAPAASATPTASTPLPTSWQPPPPCPTHAGGKIVRDGFYGGHSERRRQRYRCEHDPCTESCRTGCPGHHRFTPPLPRDWVLDEVCDVCEETRGVHHGTPAAARRHTFSSRVVAGGLIRLAHGDSYGGVGEWALESRKGKRASRATGTTKRPSKAVADNRWHIGADWVEMFAPVVWDPLEAEFRARAIAERQRLDAARAAGEPLRNPIIWIADETPVFGATNLNFAVLVVAECEWREGQVEPIVRLRVARAMPDQTTASWLLVWDELAGPDNIRPDFLVSDQSAALMSAARSRLGPDVRWVPSVWHITRNLRMMVAGKSIGRARTEFPELESHLALLSRGSLAFESVEHWAGWWDELETILQAVGVKGSLANRRKLYEAAFAAVIPDFANAWIPISNAGIENLIKSRIRPIFYKRTAFTSIERTNHLLDLAVAASRGRLNNEATVARLLREDAHDHGGWTVAARSIGDPEDSNTKARYRSLRDPSLSVRAAYARGLA